MARQHAANAAGRVSDFAGIARKQMNVNMHARLTGRTTNVRPDVVILRRVLRLYERTRMAE